MNEVERIVDQYDRVLTGDAWHGDNVWKILGEVQPEQAFQRIWPGTHTIWELVAHMSFWESEVCRRLKRQPGNLDEKMNFPPMPEATVKNWSRALDQFRRSNEEFRSVLGNIAVSKLDEPLSAAGKSIYVEIHGVIQHHLYHAGQIAILRKNLAVCKVATGL